MTAYEIILKKRSGQELLNQEIEFLIDRYTKDKIPDYQIAAFLMAVYFQGMSFTETTALTEAMMRSGKIFNLAQIKQPKIDKHSTGGVGDKVSLILAPIIACLNITVPMVSGRGLGHTGGTLDKLESIPGFRTNLSEKEFVDTLKKIGVAMMGQTKTLAPADKKLYALRDVTATVDSIPLIAASIMSKKMAAGIDGLVLDVKTGTGAFMRDIKNAKELAKVMIEIGKRMGKKVVALITNMEQPLGNMVGNSLEIIESIEALKGNGPADLIQVTFALAEEMLVMSTRGKKQEARRKIEQVIKSGQALEKLRALIKAQAGNDKVIDNYKLLPQAKYRVKITSPKQGYIQKLDAMKIGLLSVQLGCGRTTMDDRIDKSAGFIFKKKIGDFVHKGDELVTILGNDPKKVRCVKENILAACKIGSKRIKPPKIILAHLL
ncbi:MAG: thymidine phosphorylase [Candidatus Latescibacteria bacterium]|nr:thymidine phosphorylase [Candidatus Latescibacterota bacterium]